MAPSCQKKKIPAPGLARSTSRGASEVQAQETGLLVLGFSRTSDSRERVSPCVRDAFERDEHKRAVSLKGHPPTGPLTAGG